MRSLLAPACLCGMAVSVLPAQDRDEAIELVRRSEKLDPLTHRNDVPNMLLRAGGTRTPSRNRCASLLPFPRTTARTLRWAGPHVD
jgi:hypothetical protein